jgi:ribosomal protein S18 acetylase RimI-like enzyme
MKIRTIRRADLPALARLNARIFRDISAKQALLVFRHSFSGRVDGACLVAVEGSELVGAIFCEKKLTQYPNSAYITAFFISKKQQGKGIGKALMGASLQAMKKRGITNVSLTVSSRNRRAHALYRQAGFKPFRLMLLRRF